VPLEGDPVRHTAKTSKTQAGFRGPSSLAVRLFRAPAPVWCVADCDDPDTPGCMFVTAAAIGRLVARPRLCSVSLTSRASFDRAVKQPLIMHFQPETGSILTLPKAMRSQYATPQQQPAQGQSFPVRLSLGGCSFRLGRTSILLPRPPHLAHLTRDRNHGTSAGRAGAWIGDAPRR
jgi:hypothetical protein